MDEKPPVAVLTGDIIEFSAYDETARRKILSVLQEEAGNIQLRHQKQAPFPIGLFRGDGWQLVLLDPSIALLAALLIRCALKSNSGAQTRIAVAVGEADYLPEGSTQTGDGEVFRASGYLLEALSRRINMGFRWPSANPPALETVIDAMLRLLDTITGQWTAKQARAVYGALQGFRQVDIARSWPPEPITQQAVAQHLDSANWPAVAHTLEVFAGSVGKNNLQLDPPAPAAG